LIRAVPNGDVGGRGMTGGAAGGAIGIDLGWDIVAAVVANFDTVLDTVLTTGLGADFTGFTSGPGGVTLTGALATIGGFDFSAG
jgi:hypothetical protein